MDYYRKLPSDWQSEFGTLGGPDVFLGELPSYVEDTLDAAYDDTNNQDFKDAIIACKLDLSQRYLNFLSALNTDLDNF